jgi:hypothetical protein
MSKPEPSDDPPLKLSKREWNILGTLFVPVEFGGKRRLGPKTALKFVNLGLVEWFEEMLPPERGQPAWLAVKISGYRLTHMGNYYYCRWAGTQPVDPEDV